MVKYGLIDSSRYSFIQNMTITFYPDIFTLRHRKLNQADNKFTNGLHLMISLFLKSKLKSFYAYVKTLGKFYLFFFAMQQIYCDPQMNKIIPGIISF